ncbi:hypothetical protein PPTG_21884 [Phytophthora nicotianae INRA-310]|uniref:Uncharacterized protein n=1 Tax=Phytophthora nicotianae (strain INRA-310) TaxID=761204 RepID=W2QTA0_PHYN3|nr:hypothetical protein PPTG_21884 [Phytophthora nicotianae INRA-310]ETN16206.1 hypothetical protein PPTG_21884 [Phytophthora nicotianae INRA-310]
MSGRGSGKTGIPSTVFVQIVSKPKPLAKVLFKPWRGPGRYDLFGICTDPTASAETAKDLDLFNRKAALANVGTSLLACITSNTGEEGTDDLALLTGQRPLLNYYKIVCQLLKISENIGNPTAAKQVQ